MEELISLRPFVPARDFGLSKRFYQMLGFELTTEDQQTAILKLGGFSFILQDFYVKELADNFMIQLLVRDADTWWRRINGPKLAEEFAVKAPTPPVMQRWGMKVGFLFDPSGVLWHIAETAI